MRPVQRMGALLALSMLLSATPLAQSFRVGQKITASPSQNGDWQSCTVAGGPFSNGFYKVTCAKNPGDEAFIAPKWMSATPKAAGDKPAVTAAEKAEHASAVQVGSYLCWAYSQARPLLNLEVTGPGSYKASDGSKGTFKFSADSGAVAFTGYERKVLPEGFTVVYYIPQGRPTFSFRGPGGAEASFCQKQ